MAPLIVEGDSLGQKHRNYNKLVNKAIKKNPTQHITAINYEEPDLDNLYKIDLACNCRNVEYILEVLKCEDMLYISRVIKKSTWLITEQKYSFIINPGYLYNSLYPKMTSKAFNKFVLHIRLNLKEEERVESFFNYYKEKDLQKALKWLPGCSIPVIENIIQKHAEDIPKEVMKRLYEKSINFLEIFIRSSCNLYNHGQKILPAMFHLNDNVEKFLDIIEATNMDHLPRFGPKYTKRLMEKNPERIMNNLEKYVYNLDIATFAKFVKKEDAKDFILTHIKNKKMRSWFDYRNIKYFLNRLPFEERFDFVKKYFIEKSFDAEDTLKDETWNDVVAFCSPPLKENVLSSKNIYNWYIYASFSRAFDDMKQLIRNESNPAERNSILRVMLTCAGRDEKNIHTLLKYYRENHINEAFKFKIQFVNNLICNTDTQKYDKETWEYLNDLFNSMEVYTKSENNDQSCVRAIIIRNIIIGENVPEIIEQFKFENLAMNKFNAEEKEKIFIFLYNYLFDNVKEDCKTEKEFIETVEIIVKLLELLKDSNKNLKNYPFILQKIKDLLILRKKNDWNLDLSGIYNIKKSWRKILFAESILLSPTEDSFINVLKHGPQLLETYREEINKLFINENMFFERFLKKIRIYYHQSLAKSFKETFLKNLDKITNHVALMKGLCILLSQKEISEFIHKYVPTDAKIDWSHSDDLEFCIRKYIAKCMQIARPQPPLSVVLEFAKGDYLQYVLPSLNAILYNASASYICDHIMELLNTPVSLQKHGIRIAFSKLKYEELKTIFSEIWKSSKNSTIRSDIFCQTYKMLCKENNESVILEIWELLSLFIDKLTFDESKKIYVTLSKVDSVPLCVRAAFWVKSYNFLKQLPPKTNSQSLIDDLHTQVHDILEFLESDFMAKVYFENFDKKFSTQRYDYYCNLAMYLLSTKTDTAQSERSEKILIPLLDKAIALWDEEHDNVYYTRCNLSNIFSTMSTKFEDVVLNKDMIFPIAMYTAALNKLQNSLSIKENYILLTNIKLSLGYVKILHDLKTNKELKECSDFKGNADLDQANKWKNMHAAAAPIFGRLCSDYLKEDVAKHFPSIYIIFADVLDNLLVRYTREMNKLKVLKVFLESKDFIQGHLLVMKIMPRYYLYDDEEKALRLDMIKEISTHPSEEVAMHYWLFQKDD